MGSRREALKAGYIPKKMPTEAEKPSPMANDHHASNQQALERFPIRCSTEFSHLRLNSHN